MYFFFVFNLIEISITLHRIVSHRQYCKSVLCTNVCRHPTVKRCHRKHFDFQTFFPVTFPCSSTQQLTAGETTRVLNDGLVCQLLTISINSFKTVPRHFVRINYIILKTNVHNMLTILS